MMVIDLSYGNAFGSDFPSGLSKGVGEQYYIHFFEELIVLLGHNLGCVKSLWVR